MVLKKIKVLHTEWSQGWGGQEIRIISEILAMREIYGVESIIACKKDAMIAKKAREFEIEVINFDFSSNFDLKSVFGIANFIKKNKIDIVNTHSGKDTWVGGFGAKIAKAKFIRTRHLSQKLNPSKLNFINQMADFVITTGNFVREMMIKENRINPEKIVSITTGIDKNIFDPKIYDKFECKNQFNLNKNEIYIGFLGVLRGVKRPDLFVNVAKKIIQDFQNVNFVIAGDGPYKNFLENFINENGLNQKIKMLGHINESAKFLKAIDIYALTSRNEGVPQALMQALFMNKPSLATDVGSVKDLFFNNNFNLVKYDEDDIFLGLKNLILNFNGEQDSRQFMIENFTKEKMAEKTFKIYQEILKI